MAEDDEVLSFEELLSGVTDKLSDFSKRLDVLEKDIKFIKEKVDSNGLKLHFINKATDTLLGRQQ